LGINLVGNSRFIYPVNHSSLRSLWKNSEAKNLLFVGLEYSGLAGGVFQSTLRAAALLSAGFVAIQSGSRGYLPSPHLAIKQNDSQFFIPPFFNRLLALARFAISGYSSFGHFSTAAEFCCHALRIGFSGVSRTAPV